MKYTVSYTVDRVTITGPLARVALEADLRLPWAGLIISRAYEAITEAGGTVYNVKGEVIAGTLAQIFASERGE